MTTTYPPHANTPELRAHYDTLSPDTRAFVDRWIAWTDTMDAEGRELAQRGLDTLVAATEHQGFTACLDEIERQRAERRSPEQAIIEAVDAATRPDLIDAVLEYVAGDDELAVTDWILEQLPEDPPPIVLDHGQDSGVKVERRFGDGSGPGWLTFAARKMEIDMDLGDDWGRLYLRGDEWTMEDLRQLHADLGHLLAHPLLKGAMEEARPC